MSEKEDSTSHSVLNHIKRSRCLRVPPSLCHYLHSPLLFTSQVSRLSPQICSTFQFQKLWHLEWRTGIFLASVLGIWRSHTALMHLSAYVSEICQDSGTDTDLLIDDDLICAVHSKFKNTYFFVVLFIHLCECLWNHRLQRCLPSGNA